MTNKQKTAIVVGTGAGGAAAARELQGGYQVTILEAGKDFKPFSYPIKPLSAMRGTGLFFDERLIRLLLPNMVIDKTPDMVLVRGQGIGGTTTLATGNAVRYDNALKALGIDLDKEFEALYKELPITTEHEKRWTDITRRMYDVFAEMGLGPVVTPKLMCPEKCSGCGHCAIGCPTGAKWDTRSWIREAQEKGARLEMGCKVTGLDIRQGRVQAVIAKQKGRTVRYEADLVILAAGGLGTPVILENSGIPCSKSLFVDPVLCVAGPMEGLGQDRQVLMPFISQQDGYILSPYMDYLSFFFDKRWRYPMNGIASIMIKLADEEIGSVDRRRVNKTMSPLDTQRMEKAVSQCREILCRLGIPEEKQFLGTLNAGHPGGMLPLTAAEKDSLHNPVLPENLYVADATILPGSMGNPPILTIMPLAKRIASIVQA